MIIRDEGLKRRAHACANIPVAHAHTCRLPCASHTPPLPAKVQPCSMPLAASQTVIKKNEVCGDGSGDSTKMAPRG